MNSPIAVTGIGFWLLRGSRRRRSPHPVRHSIRPATTLSWARRYSVSLPQMAATSPSLKTVPMPLFTGTRRNRRRRSDRLPLSRAASPVQAHRNRWPSPSSWDKFVNGSNGERIVQGGFGGFSLLTGDGTSPRLFDGDFGSTCNCDNTVSTETEHYFFGKDEPDHFIISSGDVPNSSAVAPFERRRGIETVQTYHPAINFNRTTETLGTRSAHLASTTGTSFNRQLTGWVAGVGVSVNQSSGALAPFSFTSKTVDPNGVKIQTDPNSNKVAAAFDMTKSSGGGDLLFVTLGDDDSSFGTSPATNGHSAFLDDKTFGATVDCTSATCASTVTFNSVTAADGALAIATLDNVPGLDGTYANCSYCSWGLIAGEIEPSSPSTFERLLGFWTAGAVQDFAQIPTDGVGLLRRAHGRFRGTQRRAIY